MNKPYNFFEFWLKELKEQNKTPMQAYQEFMKNFLQPNSSTTNENKSQEFLHEIMKSQIELGKLWLQNAQNLLNSLSPQPKEVSLLEKWTKIYTSWNAQFGKPFTLTLPRHDVAEVFKNILNFSQNYMQLYQFFQPILEEINLSKKFQSNSIQKFLESVYLEKYNNLICQLFTIIVPQQSENFLQQIAEFSFNVFEELNKQTGGILRKNLENFPDLINNLQTAQYQAFGKLQRTLDPLLKTIPNSKEKQLFQLNLQLQDDYALYYIKSNEMQAMIQKTAQKALEETLKQLLEKIQNNPEQIITFEEAMYLWMDITEPMMIELYRSEKFGKLQAEALAKSTAIKNRLEKQMEILLEPLPIAPRSEIDELNATIHELRRKIRNLENELLQQQLTQKTETAPQPKPKSRVKKANS